jgi:hypothetical protein
MEDFCWEQDVVLGVLKKNRLTVQVFLSMSKA